MPARYWDEDYKPTQKGTNMNDNNPMGPMGIDKLLKAITDPFYAETWLAVIQREHGIEVEIFRTEREADDHITLAAEFEDDKIMARATLPLALYNLRNEFGEVDIEPNPNVDGRKYRKRPTKNVAWLDNEPDDTGYIPPYSAPPGFNREDD